MMVLNRQAFELYKMTEVQTLEEQINKIDAKLLDLDYRCSLTPENSLEERLFLREIQEMNEEKEELIKDKNYVLSLTCRAYPSPYLGEY